MAVMPVSHPDIFDFIKCKRQEGVITNFNLSVSIPDDFMRAVMFERDWPLLDPSDGSCDRVVSARKLFDEIVDGALKNGEPGVIFIDTVNKDNPVPDLFKIEATNPCVTADCVVNTIKGPEFASNLIGVPFETPDGVKVPNGFFKTRDADELVEITTEMGYRILCTPEHRLMVEEGDWVAAKFAEPGQTLIAASGCYKVEKAREDAVPTVDTVRHIAPLLLSPSLEEELGAWSCTIANLGTCTYPSAVALVRAMWENSGRPRTGLSIKKPAPETLLVAMHQMLLRLGIRSKREETEDEVSFCPPLGEPMFRFIVLTRAMADEIAAHTLWGRICIEKFKDPIKSVKVTFGRGPHGTEPVYDATCDPAAGKPILWTGAFLSHNCSEVPLSESECCNLGSINLRKHVRDSDRTIDWALLESTTHLAVRFLNDVIMANKYVPAVPQLEKKAKSTMRIGLGIMGLADLFFAMRVRYGSLESLSIAGQVMEFIRYHAMLESMQLSAENGPFESFQQSTYRDGRWQPPAPIDYFSLFGVRVSYVDIGRPGNINWQWLADCISRIGLRNITTTAVAPTGTLSLVAGVSGFGCEPVFALSHRRRILGRDGKPRAEHMLVPELVRAIDDHFAGDCCRKDDVMREIIARGTCAGVPGVPEAVARVFVCAADISVKEHVMMQATLQAYVDGAISKTINLPPGSTSDDVRRAMQMAWKAGCKGICVYVQGSRDCEVLTAGNPAK